MYIHDPMLALHSTDKITKKKKYSSEKHSSESKQKNIIIRINENK